MKRTEIASLRFEEVESRLPGGDWGIHAAFEGGGEGGEMSDFYKSFCMWY